MKILLLTVTALFASPAFAECVTGISLATGESVCFDGVLTKPFAVCRTDPIMCPGVVATGDIAALRAIEAQCYANGARRTDLEAKSKCANVWR